MPVTESLLLKTAMLIRAPRRTFPCEPAMSFTPRPLSGRARRKSGLTIVIFARQSSIFGLDARNAGTVRYN